MIHSGTTHSTGVGVGLGLSGGVGVGLGMGRNESELVRELKPSKVMSIVKAWLIAVPTAVVVDSIATYVFKADPMARVIFFVAVIFAAIEYTKWGLRESGKSDTASYEYMVNNGWICSACGDRWLP